jgi:hypothetical protein
MVFIALAAVFLCCAMGCTPHHEEGVLTRLEAAPVEGEAHESPAPLPTVLTSVSTDSSTFVRPRSPHLSLYPCATCHNRPLEAMKSTPKRAHWNVPTEHATKSVMSCTTCHASDNLNALRSLGGELISFDSSYDLCAQCHAPQHKDWLGGAHGKRLGGWTPPRVVALCVECHNPHRPRLDKRWPAIPSNLMTRLKP